MLVILSVLVASANPPSFTPSAFRFGPSPPASSDADSASPPRPAIDCSLSARDVSSLSTSPGGFSLRYSGATHTVADWQDVLSYAATTLCISPGDYRALGPMRVNGTHAVENIVHEDFADPRSPRYATKPVARLPTEQVITGGINFNSTSHPITVRGLTVAPKQKSDWYFCSPMQPGYLDDLWPEPCEVNSLSHVWNSPDVVLDSMWFDGFYQPTDLTPSGLYRDEYLAVLTVSGASDDFSLERSVLGRTNWRTGHIIDRNCLNLGPPSTDVRFPSPQVPKRASITSNEFVDCSDGIQFTDHDTMRTGWTDSWTTETARITQNYFYNTAFSAIPCDAPLGTQAVETAWTAERPNFEAGDTCGCRENGIDIKWGDVEVSENVFHWMLEATAEQKCISPPDTGPRPVAVVHFKTRRGWFHDNIVAESSQGLIVSLDRTTGFSLPRRYLVTNNYFGTPAYGGGWPLQAEGGDHFFFYNSIAAGELSSMHWDYWGYFIPSPTESAAPSVACNTVVAATPVNVRYVHNLATWPYNNGRSPFNCGSPPAARSAFNHYFVPGAKQRRDPTVPWIDYLDLACDGNGSVVDTSPGAAIGSGFKTVDVYTAPWTRPWSKPSGWRKLTLEYADPVSPRDEPQCTDLGSLISRYTSEGP